jgi:hypothetical protein
MASEGAVWPSIGRMLTEDARRLSASRLEQADGATRDELRLALAASLLTAPPTSEGRLGEAEDLLRQLVDGRHGAEALWLLARIPHVHRAAPDAAEAAVRYRRLIDTHPDHALAAQAEVKLAIIELAPLSRAGADAARRDSLIAAHEGALPSLADPIARRDLRLVLAEARLHAGCQAEALTHLETAITDGLVSGPAVGDLLVRAGELARLLGEPARAAGHYRAFLAAFPRDQRAHLVRERLAGVAP